MRHAGDIARLVATKRHVIGEIVPRLLFGAKVQAPRSAGAVDVAHARVAAAVDPAPCASALLRR